MSIIEVKNLLKTYRIIEKEDGLIGYFKNLWSFYRIYTFTEYPISIYNKFIRIIITVILPFAFVAYYPTMAYLGFNTYMIYLSLVVAIILWIVAVKLWNLALNKYRSTGT